MIKTGPNFNPAHVNRLRFRIDWASGDIMCVHGIVVDTIPDPTRADWREWHDEGWDAHAYDEHCRFH